MKIAIPSMGKELDSQVNQSFGRTQYFIIADSETMEADVIDNSAASAQGGAGIKAAQAIADSGAGVLVTENCGENAANVLKSAGVKILKAVPGTVRKMVELFKADELQEFKEINPGHYNGGR